MDYFLIGDEGKLWMLSYYYPAYVTGFASSHSLQHKTWEREEDKKAHTTERKEVLQHRYMMNTDLIKC